ncbi:unnamed protein product [Ilex paraguariensis]|uniref:Secreted protein n=1 Tax=Ilex paraguariensis TaxID=185542 RepID=A0ABC8TA02_9AQUA
MILMSLVHWARWLTVITYINMVPPINTLESLIVPIPKPGICMLPQLYKKRINSWRFPNAINNQKTAGKLNHRRFRQESSIPPSGNFSAFGQTAEIVK